MTILSQTIIRVPEYNLFTIGYNLPQLVKKAQNLCNNVLYNAH